MRTKKQAPNAKANHFPAFENNVVQHAPAHPIKELVKRLTEMYGPSGHEGRIREYIRDQVKSYADEIRVDALGNLIVKKKGSLTGDRKKIMLAAHMDEIGVIVSHVNANGFLHFASIGGIYPLTLLGQRCIFENGTIGVFHREGKGAKPREIEYEKMYIDVGATNGKLPVGVGDAAGMYRGFVDLGERMISKTMDDRIGCAVLVETLRLLKKCPNDVYFVFTVQEEVGTRGAGTAAFAIQPDLALAIDVTATGDTPESDPPMAVSLGQGPAIKVKDSGMLVPPAVRDLLIAAAREANTPYQLEILTMGSTDAREMQVTREGIHAGVISIPCRYVHTTSEMVDWSDVQNSVKLLTALLNKPLKI